MAIVPPIMAIMVQKLVFVLLRASCHAAIRLMRSVSDISGS